MSSPVTPTASVEAVHDSATEVAVGVPAARAVGAVGAVVSVGGGVVPAVITGYAFVTSSANCDSNQAPASGALGEAPVRWLASLGDTNVGSHMRSKPLPWSFAMSVEAPSDSPGGLIHTYASRYELASP